MESLDTGKIRLSVVMPRGTRLGAPSRVDLSREPDADVNHLQLYALSISQFFSVLYTESSKR
jgi:hypothetical protein